MEAAGCRPQPGYTNARQRQQVVLQGRIRSKEVLTTCPTKSYRSISGRENFIILENKKRKCGLEKPGSKIYDLGDGVLDFSWHTKSYTLGSEVIEGLNKAIDPGGERFPGPCGSVTRARTFPWAQTWGWSLCMRFEQEYDEIDFMIKHFQNTVMRIRYSGVPWWSAAEPHSGRGL